MPDKQDTTAENTNGMNTAIKFHIESASDDILAVIKNATSENIALYKDQVLYNQITISNAIAMCKDQQFNKLAGELTTINNRLTAVFADTISNQSKIDSIVLVSANLKALIKKEL
jgi:hypothetical protein